MGVSVPAAIKTTPSYSAWLPSMLGQSGSYDHQGVHQKATTDKLAGILRYRLNSNM